MAQKPLEGAPLVLMTIALSLATFMQVLDSTIANVAIPTIAGNLGASNSQGTWVITSFGVANAISIPITGWLAKRVGEVKLFTWATILFAIASWACGMSESLEMLIFFRVLQGVVAGPLIPLSQSLLLSNYPPAKRSIALSLWAMTVIVAPICGPILGGWISDNYHWGWIFFINVPIGAVVVMLTLQTLRLLAHQRQNRAAKLVRQAVAVQPGLLFRQPVGAGDIEAEALIRCQGGLRGFALRRLNRVAAARHQRSGKVILQLFHLIDAGAKQREPAQRARLLCLAERAGDAPQPLHFPAGGRQRTPAGQRVGVGKLAEGGETLLLRRDQRHHALTLLFAEAASGEACRSGGALLPRQLFALHKAEQRNQRAGNIGMAGGIRRFEHQVQQGADDLVERLHRLRLIALARQHLRAQAWQRRQRLQRGGDQIAEAAVAGMGGSGRQRLGKASDRRAHLTLARQTLLGKQPPLRADPDIAGTTLALKLMDQFAQRRNQLAGVQQPLQAGDVAVARCLEVCQRVGHGDHLLLRVALFGQNEAKAVPVYRKSAIALTRIF